MSQVSSTLVSQTPMTASMGQPADDALVTVQNVSKVFKDFWMRERVKAVNSLTFDIRPREVFGLLGPNGSGKSTTIKMILGLLRPSAGRIALFGKPPSEVSVKHRIGYLPEESYMYGFLNARETLEYYGKLFELDYRTRQKRVDELLDMLGLVNAQFRPVREYSKGMQRRIGIAQALINDPDLLILDEPTTGLDPIGTKQIKDLIIELGRRGKTVLLSSHLLADVEDCVDRLIILYGGQKRAEGTCDSLLVTQSKTTIETEALDEGTIAEIDRVIRQRSGGSNAVSRVSKPRQSLESLFLDIVERAKLEIATSGATSGGQTASFLRSEDEAEDGQALIDKLVSVQPAQQPDGLTETSNVSSRSGAPASSTVQRGPDESLIYNLVSEPTAPKAPSPTAATQASYSPSQPRTPAATQPKTSSGPAQPSSSAEVDVNVISKLLDLDSNKSDGQQGGGKA